MKSAVIVGSFKVGVLFSLQQEFRVFSSSTDREFSIASSYQKVTQDHRRRLWRITHMENIRCIDEASQRLP